MSTFFARQLPMGERSLCHMLARDASRCSLRRRLHDGTITTLTHGREQTKSAS